MLSSDIFFFFRLILRLPVLRVAFCDAFDFERLETFTTDAVVLLLPFVPDLENVVWLRRVLATANLFGAIDGGLAVGLLRALTCVTIIFESFSNLDQGSISLTTRCK